jgi:DNA-directed RNA polymerase subunit beta'
VAGKPATTSVGRLLLNDALPPSHQIDQPMARHELSAHLADLARTDPSRYVQAIAEIKRIGDAVATDEGVTIGLDDIEPDYKTRDALLEPTLADVKRTQDPERRIRLIEDAQAKLLEATKRHPGQAAMMVRSGARGSMPQVMRTVTSPVAITDDRGRTVPWIISKSYAEGLKPIDAWIALGEARRNAVESNISVSAPGEVSKLLIGNMGDQLITMPDCGTTNGLALLAEDPQARDRYLAQPAGGLPAGTLVDGQIAGRLSGKTIVVRSPMTCEAPHGVCQKCYGLNTRGQAPRIGDNVGMIAAHALGEPLTQMALNAKHATRTTASRKAILSGLAGFKQLTEVPQSFFNRAVLADRPGLITGIAAAPQGGHYVDVDREQHYVPPNLGVQVQRGDRVEAGDVLSDGIPRPDDVVKYKGLGVGRQYLVDQLQGIYRRHGLDMDRRHLELLAKTDLNYVKVMDRDAEQLGLLRGDVVDYNQFRKLIADQSRPLPLADAIGETLADNMLHYTAGTRVTPAVAADLRRVGVKTVPVAPRIPLHEPLMKPISRTPLLRPDWLARLAHRNLKESLLEGAAFGETSELHGTHPIPPLVIGASFGAGPPERY